MRPFGTHRRFLHDVLLLAALLLVPHAASGANEDRVDFATQIRPILEQHCTDCHGNDDPESGFQLLTRKTLLEGGYSGPAIILGNSAESPFIQLVAGTHADDLVMPPEGDRLSDQQITLLRNWIDQDAPWPDDLILDQVNTNNDKADHWAYKPISNPAPPEVKQADWIRQPLDRFILRRLESQNIQPSPEADRMTMLRRVTLDLIGLPPTRQEIEDFLADESPDAYEKVVDRLLASPHYGERWARPWLDLCHFAESDGYLTDQIRPVAWRYRDWLIDALNYDLPFDQFTVEQLAGDLLPGATTNQKIATGFLRNTLSNREGGADLEEFRVEQIIDRTVITSTVWLGLTANCARCHDHKYDALTQKEFYQLYAFFDAADEINIDAPLPEELEPHLEKVEEYQRKRQELIAPQHTDIEALQKRWEVKLMHAYRHPGEDHVWDRQWEVLGLVWGGNLGEGQLEGCQIVKLPRDKRTALQQDRLLDYFLKSGAVIDQPRYKEFKLGSLNSQLLELKKQLPPVTRAPTVHATQIPHDTHLHIRGNFRNPGIIVQPDTPSVFPPPSVIPAPSIDQPLDRLSLARWLVSDEHPLSARLAVNRAWQEFFGTGLVETSENFGKLGTPPSHPELLDWLATELINNGWSNKRLHRQIVTSATYRQSSRARSDNDDPNNTLLARQASLRLSAEQVRDVTLAASGLLTPNVGGPSVFPPQPESVVAEGFDVDWKPSTGADRTRRGLYTFTRRQTPFAQNVTFDGADPSQICTRRQRSNTPLQALTLLNDPVFFEAAQALAGRLLGEEANSFDQRIENLYLLCLARTPTQNEVDRLSTYWQQQLEILQQDDEATKAMSPLNLDSEIPPAEAAAWTGLASVVLNLHEFITRE